MRIALVYDCLFPHTVGGAERWYRNLAERLDGRHQVVYLTRRQWDTQGPQTPFETVAVARGGALYSRRGRRRTLPPLRFGWGIFWHLLRHADRYDVVHTASFPYFSVLGAALALRLRRSRAKLIVDWHELWTRSYWLSYLGPVGGRIGMWVQSLCLPLPDHSFAFSRLVTRRLEESRHRGPITHLTGEYAGPESTGVRAPSRLSPQPLVVFAGRHIPEKHVPAIPTAIAVARKTVPDLKCVILGDGPETEAVREAVRALGLEHVVDVRGRVDPDEVEDVIASATCLLHPSEREGYGLVVVEAAALGTPSIVVEGSENAAIELIEPGTNGFVAESRASDVLARYIVTAARDADGLRHSTLDWYESNRVRLSLRRSLETVEFVYDGLAAGDASAESRSVPDPDAAL